MASSAPVPEQKRKRPGMLPQGRAPAAASSQTPADILDLLIDGKSDAEEPKPAPKEDEDKSSHKSLPKEDEGKSARKYGHDEDEGKSARKHGHDDPEIVSPKPVYATSFMEEMKRRAVVHKPLKRRR